MRRRLLTAAIVCIVMYPMSGWAQTVPLTQLPARSSIEPDSAPLMDAIRRQTSALTAQRTDERSPGQQVSTPAREGRSWIGRHPALFGALVGAAAGTVAAGTMNNELFCGTGSDEDCLFYTGSRFAIGAGIGAGVGALTGWIVSLGRD